MNLVKDGEENSVIKPSGSRPKPTAGIIGSMRQFFILAVVALGGGSLLADVHEAALTVTVTNIPRAEGNLLIGIYNDKRSFIKKPLPQSQKIDLTTKDDVTAKIPGLSPGNYAIVVIQDLNENGKLDKTLLGIPKEPLAFSVIEKIPKGEPKFEACSFEVGEKDLEMTIAMGIE